MRSGFAQGYISILAWMGQDHFANILAWLNSESAAFREVHPELPGVVRDEASLPPVQRRGCAV